MIAPADLTVWIPGRCSCGDPATVVFEGREWCGFCALLCVGDLPADRWRDGGQPG